MANLSEQLILRLISIVPHAHFLSSHRNSSQHDVLMQLLTTQNTAIVPRVVYSEGFLSLNVITWKENLRWSELNRFMFGNSSFLCWNAQQYKRNLLSGRHHLLLDCHLKVLCCASSTASTQSSCSFVFCTFCIVTEFLSMTDNCQNRTKSITRHESVLSHCVAENRRAWYWSSHTVHVSFYFYLDFSQSNSPVCVRTTSLYQCCVVVSNKRGKPELTCWKDSYRPLVWGRRMHSRQ